MRRIYSNGPSRDFVINPFNRLLAKSSRLYLAAPYFTAPELVVEAANAGKSILLLVGLNAATSPQALVAVHGITNLAVRYLTRRFHAKIYIFDDAAMVGSSNLTDGGLRSNREAVICLDQSRDVDEVDEIRGLFLELWGSAHVLTPEKLTAFRNVCSTLARGPDPNAIIETAVGRAEPENINVGSHNRTHEHIFLQELRRQVYEEYRPAFEEVTRILSENGFRRSELEDLGTANETNRFLNWVRLSYVLGDDAWRTAPSRSPDARRNEILQYGREWTTTEDSKIPTDYVEWLRTVQSVFGTPESIEVVSKEEITHGLMSIHAFAAQRRFVLGGSTNLPDVFWAANNQDMLRVKKTLVYLLHGPGDFISRLHDTLFDAQTKLSYFGKFCALELFGTIKPQECPPLNGRTAKALRYLGFDVRAT